MTSVRRKIVIVGSGLAGMFCALRVAEHHDVLLITKRGLGDGSTAWAQGGIAAAVGPEDTVTAHVVDTLDAGAGLCDPVVASVVCADAPRRVGDLATFGVMFDRTDDDGLALAREGAHSRPRVVHAGGDATGRHVADALAAGVRAHNRISVLDGMMVTEVIVNDAGVTGVQLADGTVVRADRVVLATGGSGHLFARTTNPAGATADGPALAHRAGAALADIEMVQFHPTALAIGNSPLDLVSEAVRGAGGMLFDATGAPVMQGVHPMGDLGPRDVVARAVFRRARETGQDVVMSLAHLDPARVRARFPEIAAVCAANGIDLATDPVPVTPAAHYAMGGVLTDLSGRTTIPGLWAIGECASTGLHGANRLASNGLLEAAALGERAAADIAGGGGDPAPGPRIDPTPLATGNAESTPVRVAVGHIMWAGCGLERDADGLAMAAAELDALPDPRDPEVANLLHIARLAVRAAAAREESRGAHFRTDFPDTDPAQARRTAWAGDQAHHLAPADMPTPTNNFTEAA